MGIKFRKLNDSEWILKLLTLSNNKNINKYLEVNKNTLFYSNTVYHSIKSNVLSMINNDPIDLIADLVNLRINIEEQISYLNNFLTKHNEEELRKIIKGHLNTNYKIEFYNYGLFTKDSAKFLNFNKE